jgi:serine protease Do
MRLTRGIALGLLAMSVLLTPSAAAQSPEVTGPLAEAMRAAIERVVKVHGGSLGRQEGYGSGVLVSEDGRVLTVLSSLLDAPALRVVLPDGRRLPARVLARDERRQLALLQVEATGLPFFRLENSSDLQVGDWVVSAANPFRVAAGPEPVSVSAGVFAGRTNLDARRRAQEFAFTGEVLLTDLITATPGTPGGALVDARGRLVGLLGKRVISRRTNTWLNYAVPVEEAAAMLDEFGRGELNARTTGSEGEGLAGVTPVRLGIRLFDVGGRTQLAYVERVRPGSVARTAGVRPGDLVLAVDDTPVSSCDELEALLKPYGVGDEVDLLLKRGEEVVSVKLPVPEAEE